MSLLDVLIAASTPSPACAIPQQRPALKCCPPVINGKTVTVKPRDCRRTYVRLQFEAGAELVAIQQNLGHTTVQMTLTYIGRLDADKRRARGVIHYDLKRVWSLRP